METLEPRRVERPFHWRWLRSALQLMLRSPWQFGTLIAVLAFIDTSAARYLRGLAVPQALFEWVGLACLPLVWALVCVVARGAEDRGRTWPLLLDFARSLAWCRALFAGGLIVSVLAAVLSLRKKVPNGAIEALPGELLSSFAAQCYVCWAVYGLCYCPLLVFMPGLSGWRAWRLSRQAERLNDSMVFWVVLYSGNLLVLLVEKFLSYGIAAAAWLAYSGALGYVAYKDIFERRTVQLSRLAPQLIRGKRRERLLPLGRRVTAR